MIVVPLVIIALIPPFLMPKAVKERALFTVTQRMHAGQVEIAGIRLDTSTSARMSSWKKILTKDFIKHPVLGYMIPTIEAEELKTKAEGQKLKLILWTKNCIIR